MPVLLYYILGIFFPHVNASGRQRDSHCSLCLHRLHVEGCVKRRRTGGWWVQRHIWSRLMGDELLIIKHGLSWRKGGHPWIVQRKYLGRCFFICFVLICTRRHTSEQKTASHLSILVFEISNSEGFFISHIIFVVVLHLFLTLYIADTVISVVPSWSKVLEGGWQNQTAQKVPQKVKSKLSSGRCSYGRSKGGSQVTSRIDRCCTHRWLSWMNALYLGETAQGVTSFNFSRGCCCAV